MNPDEFNFISSMGGIFMFHSFRIGRFICFSFLVSRTEKEKCGDECGRYKRATLRISGGWLMGFGIIGFPAPSGMAKPSHIFFSVTIPTFFVSSFRMFLMVDCGTPAL